MVNKSLLDSKLQLVFDLGTIDGSQKVRRKTFSGLKENIEPQSVQDVARSIQTLQQHTLMDVIVVDRSRIREN